LKNKINILIVTLIFTFFAIINNSCVAREGEIDNGLPAFLNGVDENSYLASWTGKTYKEGGETIPPEDLPYKYFASKGINSARIRVWVGDSPDGNYDNALANGLAAREAGLYTLLAIFFSEQWSENVSCNNTTVGSIFRDLSFEDKKIAVQQYCRQLINNFKNDGLSFDLYAVGNEVYNCICGESDKSKMAEILNAAYQAIRDVDPTAKFVFHIPHATPGDILTYFNEMLNTHGVKCDYLSTSFYPLQSFHSSTAFEEYKTLVSDLYTAHRKPFIVSEWAYADSELSANSYWIESGIMVNEPLNSYEQTPQGQSDLIRDLLHWAREADEVKGVYYWGSMFNEEGEFEGTLYGWVWLSLFDINGETKQAVNSLQYGSLN
jgi:arabinogalactan endo-1,4-beta-galactosidase